jgi:hypothetical protein
MNALLHLRVQAHIVWGVAMSSSSSLIACAIPEDDRLLSRKEVARYLGVCPKTVDRLDDDFRPDRKFPHCYLIKLPGRKRPIKRWSLREVLEYLRSTRGR